MNRKKTGFPKRGEVWWINFDPSIGTEITKTRPAVVVSNDISNEFLERIQVVPITRNTEKIYPSESLVTVKGKKNKAAADQLATVSKRRVYKKITKLSDEEMNGVEYVLKVQLGLR
jgi:mRNA interferase MazF